MAPSWTSITFRGSTIITPEEGIYLLPTIGHRQYLKEFPRLIGVDGVIPKYYAKDGCNHLLTIRFLSVSIANCAVYRARIEALDQPQVGTLIIPDHEPIPNCVLEDYTESPSALSRQIPSVSAAYEGPHDRSYTLEFQLKFRQAK